MEAIKTMKLTKSYGKARGIIDIDLSVREGEFFGFVGPNGAGKSTTIRALLGLISPSSGTATIFGMDVVKRKNEVLRNIGYLPSETTFYAGMKVSEILRLSSDLRHVKCGEETKRLCERLQLDTSRKVDELSFGNRKKVGIVCALAHNPKLLILDEPTSGLDPLMQREFFTILRERRNAGTTLFLSSHVLSEIQRNCSHAAIIREGRLIACDRVENLAKTSAKRITVHGDFDAALLSCVKDLQTTSDSVSFLYSGDINELVHALAARSITDLSISEPDLEEIFMHYYTSGGEAV